MCNTLSGTLVNLGGRTVAAEAKKVIRRQKPGRAGGAREDPYC